MIDKLLSLWKNNKVLFWILCPLILIAFGINLFLNHNVDAGREGIIDAENKDNELKAEQDKLNNEANKEKIESDQIENEIDNLDIGEEWNKNK